MNILFYIILISTALNCGLFAQQPKAIEVQTGRGTTTIKVYPGIKSEEVYSPEEKRFALVMGVSDYDYLNQLPCVKNDVDTVRRALQNTGFDVAVALDKTKAEFEAIIDESRQYCIDNGYNIITIYYSGHGAQFGNVQMLAPKDFLFTATDTSGRLKEFMDNSILLPSIIGKLNIPTAKAVLAISDACRSEDYTKASSESPLIPSHVITKFSNIQKTLEGSGNIGILYSSLNGTTSSSAPVISVFTQYLLGVLAKKPGNFGDLAIRIAKEMQDKGENQSPVNTNNPIKYDFKFFRSGIAQPKTEDMTSKTDEKSSITEGVVFTTADGYKAIKIGDQIWMAENLNVDHYSNGEPIPKIIDINKWGQQNSGAYCNYNNDPGKAFKYGKLYNWYAVNDTRGLAPKGWHIPTEDEWGLLSYKIENSKDGFLLLSNFFNNSNNKSIYGGFRLNASSNGSDFWGIDDMFNCWSSSELDDSLAIESHYYKGTPVAKTFIYRRDKKIGLSIRCIKDQ